MGFSLKSEYAKNIFTLMSGTAIAQVLPILTTPILTRYYGPIEFGMLGMFIGIVSLLVVISTFKYDVAIIQPKDDSIAEQLFNLSFCLSSLFSVLILILINFNIEYLKTLNDHENFKYFLYLIPFTVFILSANSSLTFIINRRKNYKQMSMNKVIQGTGITLVSLTFGLLDFTSFGLLIGFLTGHTTVFFNLMYKYWNTIAKIDFTSFYSIAYKYKSYPMFALPSGLSNTAATQMPVILLAKVFNSSISGYYYLVERVLSAPITFLGSSVSSVFRQKAQEDKHVLGNYNKIFKKTFINLVFIGLPIFIIIGIFGQQIFMLVFGDEWVSTGLYAQILAPLFLLKFCISPLMSSLYISNKLNVDVIGQIVYAVLIISSIYIGYVFDDIILSISLISFFGSIFYLFFLYLTYNYSK